MICPDPVHAGVSWFLSFVPPCTQNLAVFNVNFRSRGQLSDRPGIVAAVFQRTTLQGMIRFVATLQALLVLLEGGGADSTRGELMLTVRQVQQEKSDCCRVVAGLKPTSR